MSQFIEMFSSVPKVDINCMVDTIWGSSPDSKTYNDNGEGVPFYQGKTEFGDIYINEASTFCTAPIRMAKQHAILMSVRAPVGAVNIATQDCCIGRGLASITPKVGKSITMFVFYALKYMEDEIERLGTGSTFKAINKDSYAKIQMPDVDIEKQIEFVKIAEQADKSEFVGFKSQFIEMFGGETNKVPLEEIVIVKDDCRKPINEGIRSEMKDGELYPYYGATGVVDYINDYLTDDELLCIAEDCGNYNAGEESAYIIRGKAWVNNHAHLVKTKETCDIKYLYYFLKIADLKPYVSGTTRLKLTQKKLKEISVTLPSINMQKSFVEIAEKADKSEYYN